MSTVSFSEWARTFAEGGFTEARLSYAELLMLVREIPAEAWTPLSPDYFTLETPRGRLVYHKERVDDDYYPLRLREEEWPKDRTPAGAAPRPETTAAAREEGPGRGRRGASSLSPLERAGFLVHARSLRFNRLLEETLTFLRETLSRFRAHLSFSGGKDSTLCWFLAREAGFEVPAVHFDSGGEHPASAKHIREAERLLDADGLYVYHPRLTYPEILRASYGSGLWVSSLELMRYIIDEPSARAHEDLETDAYVIGLRREESPGRDATGRFHGSLFYPKGAGPARIAPLLKWTARDVWAATMLFDLPIHPAYDERLQGESIEAGRVGVLTDLLSGHSTGTLARFKERNPADYAALKASAPEAPWPH